MRLAIPLAVGAAAAGLALAPPPADAVSIVYDEAAAAERIFTGPGALTPERGGFRQFPGGGGVFRDRDTNARYSISKVSGAKDLSWRSAEGMTERLRVAIDEAPSGMVAVDEISSPFRDAKVRTRYRFVNVRGKRIKVASHNRVRITRNGYKVIFRTQEVPEPDPESAGSRLSAAMSTLAATPHPAGGSYAERVHLYIAPAMVTSIGLGRGTHFTLDRNGSRSIRPAWRGVVTALAEAGGVWLEMYHGSTTPVAAPVWRNAPRRFHSYIRRHGGEGISRIHLLITNAKRAPTGAPERCGAPMACQFTLAASTPQGRTALANGVGAWRVGDQAGEWLAQVNRFIP